MTHRKLRVNGEDVGLYEKGARTLIKIKRKFKEFHNQPTPVTILREQINEPDSRVQKILEKLADVGYLSRIKRGVYLPTKAVDEEYVDEVVRKVNSKYLWNVCWYLRVQADEDEDRHDYEKTRDHLESIRSRGEDMEIELISA